MSINWFPGHMVAAVNKATEAMADHDVVIEVLDARCPQASSNPTIAAMRAHRQRPSLKVLNKIDVADPITTALWLDHFNAQDGVKAIGISCKKPGDAIKVIKAAQTLAPHRSGAFKTLRMMIMGIPNVGKSTLINALLKKRTAKVGDEPAVTKILHRYDLGNHMTLTDTPGLMWPKIERESDGLILAASHSIGVKAYDEIEVAAFLANLIEQRYPGVTTTRYELPPSAAAFDGHVLIERIASHRGLLLKALRGRSEPELDLERAASTLLVDFRNGRLGAMSLESPADRVVSIADLQAES